MSNDLEDMTTPFHMQRVIVRKLPSTMNYITRRQGMGIKYLGRGVWNIHPDRLKLGCTPFSQGVAVYRYRNGSWGCGKYPKCIGRTCKHIETVKKSLN
jgi:hypothetical protein